MELEGNSNSGTSVAFLKQLKEKHLGSLESDLGQRSGPPRGGDEKIPAHVGLQLVNLPGYSTDFNGDEAIRGWAREEATATCAWGTGRRCRKGWASWRDSATAKPR